MKRFFKIIQSDKIAVLKFGNNTGDPQYDIVSKMASIGLSMALPKTTWHK